MALVRSRALLRRRRRRLGVALVLVSAAAYLVMGIVQPNFKAAGLNSNESAAIATLKNISSAQSQMQASGSIDVNGNGQGEYAFFAEMAGISPLRGSKSPLAQPVLSEKFGNVVGGRVQRGGYWYQMFLPQIKGGWTTELPAGGGGPEVNAGASEVSWMCYAWPVEPGKTGNRSFFISQYGDVLATNMANEVYGGGNAPLVGLSAFAADDSEYLYAANKEDKRGNTWVVI